ncbi:14579_t:CDS:2, partial [Funneliformis caledonium]
IHGVKAYQDVFTSPDATPNNKSTKTILYDYPAQCHEMTGIEDSVQN